ncbi:MAG: crossover junction endodeoxyribonuclease RuvC [Planctomycetota bacterium]|nr:MAG: crossover junction endodeoxyribonuclease RuvC [Planctomycetota bacterium]
MADSPQANSVTILGIDPGTRIAGFGILEAGPGGVKWVRHGAIKAPGKAEYSRRLLHLADRLEELIRVYKPDEIAVEKAFFGRSIRSAFTMGEGRGVIILTAARAGVPYFEYDPTQVKKATTGNGRAQKTQVQKAIKHHLKLPEAPSPSDAADALAIAFCHALFRKSKLLGRTLDSKAKQRHNRGNKS